METSIEKYPDTPPIRRRIAKGPSTLDRPQKRSNRDPSLRQDIRRDLGGVTCEVGGPLIDTSATVLTGGGSVGWLRIVPNPAKLQTSRPYTTFTGIWSFT